MFFSGFSWRRIIDEIYFLRQGVKMWFLAPANRAALWQKLAFSAIM
jgi:hypothetical protein